MDGGRAVNEPTYHLNHVVRTRDEYSDFDGPLDVILLLLSRNRIAIADIQISSILEQYLAYLDEMKRMDLEIASEFVEMASHLLYIKTRMLLKAGDEEALSEMELLIRSLEERQRKEIYQRLQTSVQFLQERNDVGRGMFSREPEPPRMAPGYQYQHETQDLLRAWAAIVDRTAQRLPPPRSAFEGIAEAEPYPVRLKQDQMVRVLLESGPRTLNALFADCGSRSEIVAVFLALLELCRVKSVAVDEDEEGAVRVSFLRMPEEAGQDGL